MKEKREKSDYFWKIIAVVAILAFAGQSVITYQSMKKNDNVNKNTENNSAREEIQLTPRKVSLSNTNQQPPQMQSKNNQKLVPQPIPKLNVNVNSLPGVKPSITPQSTRNFPVSQLIPGGMNININHNPFAIDIREDMARMKKMMDQMMSRNGMSMTMNMGMPSMLNRPLMNGGASSNSPSITVDNDKNYVVTLKIPGLDKSEIKAKVHGNMLTVSGVQKQENRTNSQNGTSYMSSYSSFQNSFTLPGPAKGKDMKIDYKDDTLTVKVPQA